MPPSATTTTPSTPSRSGIRRLENGESIIPASTRADGSVRKEIRVKAGYRPPEDVEVYKNRTAEAWKNRGKAGVPGAESIEDNDDSSVAAASAAAAKNAKRREARKKAAAAAAAANEAGGESKGDEQQKQTAEAEPAEVDPQAEKAKEARKLAKKLRQARELKDKKEGGGSLLPEQIAKVIKINELLRQLEQLGFDENGEEKTKTQTAG